MADDLSYQRKITEDQFTRNKEINMDQASVQNLRDLKNKTDSIFISNSSYDIIKEKTIEKTITFKQDLNQIYDTISKDYSCDRFTAQILLEEKHLIIRELKNRNISNLRTLQSIFKVLQKFSEILPNFSRHKCFDVLLETMILSIVHSTVNQKKGYDRYIWDEGKEFGRIKDDLFGYSDFFTFKFVELYIWHSFFDEEKIYDVLKVYLDQQILTKDDPLNNIIYFWKMEDKEVNDLIDKIVTNLQESIYPPSKFTIILYHFVMFKELGFKFSLDSIVLLMKETENKEFNNYDDMNHFENNLSEESNIVYLEKLNEIKEQVDLLKFHSHEENIKNIISSDKWYTELYDYYLNNKDFFDKSESFLSYVNINLLANRLDDSSTKEFSHFRRSFNSIYSDSTLYTYLKNDINNIIELHNKIEAMSFTSLTKKKNREFFLELFDRIRTNDWPID